MERRVERLESDMAEINECLRIALQAPSGSNEQTWHWIVVTDPAVRTALGALYQDAYAERMARPGTGASDSPPNLSAGFGRMNTDTMPGNSATCWISSTTPWTSSGW